ncbi:MAG: peptidylprolyl isomerase [Cyanobacteria bacterium J06641_5]
MSKDRSWGWLTAIVGLFLCGNLLLTGCGSLGAATDTDGGQSTDASQDAVLSQTSDTDKMSDLPKLSGKATVELAVNGKTITAELDGEHAPITAGNFVDLVDRGFYNGLTFHRVVKEPQPFVVQGGDPRGNGTGGFVDPETNRERRIPLEIQPAAGTEPVYSQTFKQAGIAGLPKLPHTRGALSMARSQSPDSASSQFFMALADVPFLDGDYAVFGYITAGLEVMDEIAIGDKIDSAKVTSGLENLQR